MDAINVYNPGTKSFRHFGFSHLTDFPEGAQAGVKSVSSDGSGRIYFGITSNFGFVASHAMVYFDEKEGSVKRFEYPDSLNLQNVYGSSRDENGNVWILSYSGFFRIDSEGRLNKIKDPSRSEFPGYKWFSAINTDPAGMIWLTSNQPMIYSQDSEKQSDFDIVLIPQFNSRIFPEPQFCPVFQA